MRHVSELLDDDLGTRQEIARSFDDLWWLNRTFGGVSGMMQLFQRFFARTGPHPIRVLDVGAGDGRAAERLREELGRHSIAAQFAVLDRRASHLNLRRGSPDGLRPVAADAYALPFREGSFDVVVSNLFLHHSPEARVPDLLRSLASVAREAVLINDLERQWLLWASLQMLLPFARSRLTRHDGRVSVRQAYTRRELRAMAAAAGFRDFEILPLPFFRMGLILWKEGAAAL